MHRQHVVSTHSIVSCDPASHPIPPPTSPLPPPPLRFPSCFHVSQGRNFVVPFDVATVAVFVLTHRITLSGDAASRGKHGESHSTTMTLSSYDDFVAQSSEGEAGQGQTLRTNLTLITNVIASVPPPS